MSCNILIYQTVYSYKAFVVHLNDKAYYTRRTLIDYVSRLNLMKLSKLFLKFHLISILSWQGLVDYMLTVKPLSNLTIDKLVLERIDKCGYLILCLLISVR